MRPLLSTLALTLLALMVDLGAASAQEPGRVYRIGWLWTGSPGFVPMPIEQWTGPGAAFRDALRDSGFVLGKNLVVYQRHAHGDVARLAVEAESLVASGVDVIVPGGTAPTAAAMQATKRIPIVFNGVSEPVAKGIVTSLAKPGGNVTGVAVQTNEPKMWDLLRDISPTTRHSAVLTYARNRVAQEQADIFTARNMERRQAYAAAVGMETTFMYVHSLGEVEPTFAELASRGGAGVVILTDPTLFEWRFSIIAMTLRYRLPTVCAQVLEWGEAGCLVTYGEEPSNRTRRVAAQVAKILKGTKPADIPVEQPTSFKLIINAKTAKALDLTVPQSLLVLADEVIE
jgi:putative ABC transport system substrate-binding protein